MAAVDWTQLCHWEIDLVDRLKKPRKARRMFVRATSMDEAQDLAVAYALEAGGPSVMKSGSIAFDGSNLGVPAALTPLYGRLVERLVEDGLLERETDRRHRPYGCSAIALRLIADAIASGELRLPPVEDTTPCVLSDHPIDSLT